MRKSNPLDWPEGWARTADRVPSRFSIGFVSAREQLMRELNLLGAVNIVITSNLPTRANGMPYAAASRVGDPGVAVWWVQDSKEQVMACDRWIDARDNLHAIGLSIGSLRGLDRWGASDLVRRAFAGFTALPSGAPIARTWRDVLGNGGSWPKEMNVEELLWLAKGRFRNLMVAAHPDLGGGPALAIELNQAMAEAEKELIQ